MTAKATIRLIRPEHWIKNVIVLFPVLFAHKAGVLGAWVQAGLAAAAFCLASGAVYAFNDIRDRAKDLLHPQKRLRPLPAGAISVHAAAVTGAVLAVAGVAVAFAAGLPVLAAVAAYLLLQAAYTTALKRKMLVDVICIALGFVLRAVGGALAIRVAVSPWLFVCTFTLCLFMGFCKRANELASLGDGGEAADHRATLSGYSGELLTHLITLSAGVAVVSFLLYATSGRTIHHLGTDYLLYTLPLVIYGVCRFAMLSMRGLYADPTALILHDRPLQLTVVLWAAAAAAVIRWGPDIQRWARQFT